MLALVKNKRQSMTANTFVIHFRFFFVCFFFFLKSVFVFVVIVISMQYLVSYYMTKRVKQESGEKSKQKNNKIISACG